jgi:hypothetical protein
MWHLAGLAPRARVAPTARRHAPITAIIATFIPHPFLIKGNTARVGTLRGASTTTTFVLTAVCVDADSVRAGPEHYLHRWLSYIWKQSSGMKEPV